MIVTLHGTEEEILAYASRLVSVTPTVSVVPQVAPVIEISTIDYKGGYLRALRFIALAHDKLAAIKIHRSTTGCSIKDAKDFVETL